MLNTKVKTIGMLILLVGGIFSLRQAQLHNQKKKQEQKNQQVHQLTKQLADPRKKCDFMTVGKRIECLDEKLTQITDKNFDPKFSLFQAHAKSELEVENHSNWVKIKRPTNLKMATGSCVVSFYLFDFDDKYIYLSKDNSSGVIVCGNSQNNFIIAPSSFSEAQAEQSAKFLKNLHF